MIDWGVDLSTEKMKKRRKTFTGLAYPSNKNQKKQPR
jgi:hypothetical protein